MLPAFSNNRVLEPFVVMLLQLSVDESQVANDKSWYHYEQVASFLFANHIPSHLHVSIGEGI